MPETTARSIVTTLQQASFEAYYAGGCVRDQLLGFKPKDYDVATAATPDDIRKLFPKHLEVGAHFGVMIVVHDGESIEVATFRSDGNYSDGRRPDSVQFTSAKEDARRRDFTINGMFYDPLQQQFIDYVGGQQDIEALTIRAIGEPAERIAEDRLRMLRAVRFATALNFEIDPPTWQAVQSNASTITKISPERIREELVKIFLSPNRARGLDLLDESGLLKVILPEVHTLHGCEQPPQFHPEGDVFVHTRIMLELLPDEVSIPLVFGVLFHDIGKPPTFTYDESEDRIRFNGHDQVGARMTEDIMRRLKFSNSEIEATCELVSRHMIFKDVQQMRTSKLKRFMSQPNFEDELELHRVDCASSHGMLDNHEFLQVKIEEFANEPLIPEPLITGRDLIALGWKPGPVFKEILHEVQSRQLEGILTDRDAAIKFVKSSFPQTSDSAGT